MLNLISNGDHPGNCAKSLDHFPMFGEWGRQRMNFTEKTILDIRITSPDIFSDLGIAGVIIISVDPL